MKEKLEKMNIAFDFSNKFAIARVPFNYGDAENFALDCVYSLVPYVAEKLNIDYSKVVLVAISQDNKVVVFSVLQQSDSVMYTLISTLLRFDSHINHSRLLDGSSCAIQ